MSINLSAAAQQLFDDQVHHLFQDSGKLRGAVTVRNGVVADVYNFRRMGKGLANQKPTQADVTPMDVGHALIPATLTNWNAPEYTDIFDAAEVNFDEQSELAETIASAMGRRQDQLIIDALDTLHANSGSYAGTVTAAVGGSDTNLNLAKVLRASNYLNDEGVPQSGRHICCSASGLEAMLDVTEVGSSDYNNVQALIHGQLNYWMGFTWHVIESRDEGGLAIDGSDVRTHFAWHESAVGLAIGLDIRTEVNYVPQKTSWLCNGIFKAGAVVRDATGVVEILSDET